MGQRRYDGSQKYPEQGRGQIRLIEYKYKYFYQSFKYKYKYDNKNRIK